jgi:hypothetical protein
VDPCDLKTGAHCRSNGRRIAASGPLLSALFAAWHTLTITGIRMAWHVLSLDLDRNLRIRRWEYVDTRSRRWMSSNGKRARDSHVPPHIACGVVWWTGTNSYCSWICHTAATFNHAYLRLHDHFRYLLHTCDTDAHLLLLSTPSHTLMVSCSPITICTNRYAWHQHQARAGGTTSRVS